MPDSFCCFRVNLCLSLVIPGGGEDSAEGLLELQLHQEDGFELARALPPSVGHGLKCFVSHG